MTTTVTTTRRNRPSLTRRIGSVAANHAVLIITSIILGFPLLWMVLTSLKTNEQALLTPPVFFPNPVKFDNYPQMINAVSFFRFILNTLIYAAITIVGVLFSSTLVAYGFSRLEWRGRDLLFKVMVSTMLIPFFATLIPLFVMYKNFHMLGWYMPLIVPTFFGSSIFSTFLLRQFFMTIPQSVADAGRVDGASELTIFARIIVPLAKPAMATVILFQFVYCWNDYLGPLIYINNTHYYPISLGLGMILGSYTTNWPWVMASATAATLPIVVLFFLTQRAFIGGISIAGTADK